MTKIFLTIVITHFIADFILQDKKWAENKSRDIIALTTHAMVYSLAWIPSAVLLLGYTGIWFILITFIFHWFTDLITSKVTSRMFANRKYGTRIPNVGVFSVIGLDQLIHYLQLYFTYYILSQ